MEIERDRKGEEKGRLRGDKGQRGRERRRSGGIEGMKETERDNGERGGEGRIEIRVR